MEGDITTRKFRVGTRSSDLAKTQTYEVIDLIIKKCQENSINVTQDNFELFEIHNSVGDIDQK